MTCDSAEFTIVSTIRAEAFKDLKTDTFYSSIDTGAFLTSLVAYESVRSRSWSLPMYI